MTPGLPAELDAIDKDQNEPPVTGGFPFQGDPQVFTRVNSEVRL